MLGPILVASVLLAALVAGLLVRRSASPAATPRRVGRSPSPVLRSGPAPKPAPIFDVAPFLKVAMAHPGVFHDLPPGVLARRLAPLHPLPVEGADGLKGGMQVERFRVFTGAPVADELEGGRYLPDPEDVTAVNVAIAAGQPLLLTGEPGCGKSALARAVAHELGLGEVLSYHVRSDSRPRDTLYTFDGVRRFYDAQVQDVRAKDPKYYIELQALGVAIENGVRGHQRAVLIEAIDQAGRDFPGGLLDPLQHLRFRVEETFEEYASPIKPLIFVTSNGERALPEAFLRRCVVHEMRFPGDPERLSRIVEARLGSDLPGGLAWAASDRLLALRGALDEWEKVPGVGELLAWSRALVSGIEEGEVRVEGLLGAAPHALPYAQALIKSGADRRALAALGEAVEEGLRK